MASNDVRKIVSGSAPDFGAIFMSNRTTIQECFERKLFGLPRPFVDFVKKVKTGMVLFLFEYEGRKLHGVFQALTDGTLDIVPHAYHSSGKLFPAQVRFGVIWKCYPLYERDFCDAVRENYFAPNKFNFGLSKDQVQRLLCLFYASKVRVQRSLTKKEVRARRSRFSDEVSPMFDSEKLGLKKEDSVGEGQGTHSSGVVESSYFLGSQSLPILLSKESEHIDTSSHTLSSGLDDYIPLSTPERFDPTDSGKGLLETGTSEDTKWNPPPVTFCVDLSSEALIVPMPFGARDPNKAMSVSSSDQVQCDDSSQKHLSGMYSRVKDLYSDTEGKRPSVFSRLKLDSTAAVEEDEVKSEVTESVHEIMEKLQQSHDNMEKSTAKTESFSRENTVLTHGKKASVFARLKVASKDSVDEKEVHTQVHEIMEKLQQSHDNMEKSTAKTENFSRENTVLTQGKKASVFARLKVASKVSVDEKEVHTQVEKSTRRVGARFLGKKKTRGREVLIRRSDECGNFNMTIQVQVGKEASQVEEVQEKEERDTVDGGLGVFSSEEQQKRRRLESVVVNEIGCGCLNVQMLSQESSSGKENGKSCEGSNKSERPEDNETGLSQKDLVHAVICPTYRGEEQGKDLDNSDSMLRVQDVGGNNYCNKVGTRPLVTYQRRHKLFLS